MKKKKEDNWGVTPPFFPYTAGGDTQSGNFNFLATYGLHHELPLGSRYSVLCHRLCVCVCVCVRMLII